MNLPTIVPPSQVPTIPTYTVAVEQKTASHWIAAALGWWNCEAEGETREAALVNLNEKLAARLAQVELLQQPLPIPQQSNPWLNVAGKYENDWQFDAMLAHIADYRQELDVEMEIDS
jgi:predicted RNase H-like HicB family nuclease